MIILNLPFPISVNSMYRNKKNSFVAKNTSGKKKQRGREYSERYKVWKNAAGWDLAIQKPKPIQGHYNLRVILNQVGNKHYDPDNMVKCISDLLVTHGLIEDDSLCVKISVERYKAAKASCDVIVTESNGIPERKAA